MERYIVYDENGRVVAYRTKKLVRDYPRLKEEARNLRVKLNFGVGYHATPDGERVQSSVKTDAIPNEVIANERDLSRLNRLERLLRAYEDAWSKLSEQEQFILKLFYQSHYSKDEAIYKAHSQYRIGRTKVYSIMREGLIKMQVRVFD